jgi:selenide,water dikinase
MVCGSGVGAKIDSGRLPIIEEALDFADMGLIPTVAYENREFRREMINIADTVPRAVQDVLFDPQTSGGLLIGVSSGDAGNLVAALHKAGIHDSAIIGTVVEEPVERIMVV